MFFSRGSVQNLRGSAESNQETGAKGHFSDTETYFLGSQRVKKNALQSGLRPRTPLEELITALLQSSRPLAGGTGWV